jgi:hypothetical protein
LKENRVLRSLLTLLVLTGFAVAQPASRVDLENLSPLTNLRYRIVHPDESELRWQRIPWLTDLDDAVRQAREEKRPLLIWTSGDDPLERC